MPESHDPMCQVPLSYLTMLQERRDGAYTHLRSPQAIADEISEQEPTPSGMLQFTADMAEQRDCMRIERDLANDRINAFEERAGCALEHIPVEALNAAQDQHVNQGAIDTLKAENERLSKECNALGSELCDWRGKFKEAERELAAEKLFRGRETLELQPAAPYGVKKDGTPKAKPGRKAPRRRKAA